jgi:hypothetical protein
MSTDVELQKPETLEHAMAFACAFERRTEISDEMPRSEGRFPSRCLPRDIISDQAPSDDRCTRIYTHNAWRTG